MTSQTLTANSIATRASRAFPIIATDRSLAPVVLRLSLGAVMLPHGLQKAFGWFGGYGWDGTMGFLTGSVGMPTPLAAGVILLEVIGPVLLLLGLGTRLVGLGFAALMAGAITTVHAQYGFFMNWSGAQAGEGFEYHVIVIGAALGLVVLGGGRWSLDRKLTERAG